MMTFNNKMLALCLLVLAAAEIQGAPTYSGDWLAKELGMDNGDTAAKALNDLKMGNLATAKAAAPGGAEIPQRDRRSFLNKMNTGAYDEALKEVESVIDVMVASGINNNDPIQVGTWISLRVDRIYALKALNRYIEALVEAQRIKVLIPRSDTRRTMLNSLMESTEQDLTQHAIGPYRALQMKPTDNLKSAYKKMMLLLHPDKNTNLDSESSEYIKHLYDSVRKAFEYLSTKSR